MGGWRCKEAFRTFRYLINKSDTGIRLSDLRKGAGKKLRCTAIG